MDILIRVYRSDAPPIMLRATRTARGRQRLTSAPWAPQYEHSRNLRFPACRIHHQSAQNSSSSRSGRSRSRNTIAPMFAISKERFASCGLPVRPSLAVLAPPPLNVRAFDANDTETMAQHGSPLSIANGTGGQPRQANWQRAGGSRRPSEAASCSGNHEVRADAGEQEISSRNRGQRWSRSAA